MKVALLVGGDFHAHFRVSLAVLSQKSKVTVALHVAVVIRSCRTLKRFSIDVLKIWLLLYRKFFTSCLRPRIN